jgi:predicted permease
MLMTQSVLLAGAAGAVSAWLAFWFPRAFLALANVRVTYSVAPDWRVFLYLAAIALGAGCAAGLAPALEALRSDVAGAIKGHSGPLGMMRWKMRDSLVAAQIALSLVLLAAAGLLVTASLRVLRGEPGFDAERVLVAYSPLRFPPYTAASAESFYRELAARVRALPGVEAAAFATSIRSGAASEPVKPRERMSDRGIVSSVNQVSPDFFQSVGIRLVRGRRFSAEEASTSAPVAIVSEALARKLWPAQDPLGRQMVDRRGAVLEVVGVAGNIDPAFGVFQSVREQFYRPLAPRTGDDDLLIRYSGDVKPLERAVHETVRNLNSGLMLSTERLRTLIDRTAADAGRMSELGVCLAVVALVLAVIGIYGVVSFAASERTHEFGVRMALGATRAQITGLVIGTGWRPVGIGLAAGTAMAWGAAAGLEHVLKQSPVPLDGSDPLLYASAAMGMGLAATAAMIGPARRAARLDPAAALRSE